MSRAAAPTRRRGVSSAALRTAESSRASDPRTARSDNSSDELATEKLRSFEAPSVPEGEEIGVDEKGRRERRPVPWKGPEATPEVHVALGVGLEDKLQNNFGIDGLSIEGGGARTQVAGETSCGQLAADEQVLR